MIRLSTRTEQQI